MNFFLKCIFLILPIIVSGCKKDEKKLDLSMDAITTNNLIKDVIDEINNNYADEVTREKLEIGAINGMLGFLDEYSMYISQDEFDAFNNSTRGSFLGVGIEIKQIRDGIEITSVIDNSPASIAGLKTSDVMTKIDDKDVSEMTIKDVISKLSSDSALKIKVSIVRNKTEKFDVVLKKSVIQLESVKYDFVSDIAVIKISYFNEGTISSVSQAIKKLLKNKSVGVILDLRNNPGGILEQSIGVCDLFLNNKKIVELKSRNAEETRIIMSDDTDLINNIPMVVLIDSNTASGGELVAAALGENKRAILLGEKTYGKGSLQTIIPIPGRGAIKLTTSYFISPNGNPINQNGVTPDIEISKESSIDYIEDGKLENDIFILRAMDLIHGISALGNVKKIGN